jgi:hypothetical protein
LARILNRGKEEEWIDREGKWEMKKEKGRRMRRSRRGGERKERR